MLRALRAQCRAREAGVLAWERDQLSTRYSRHLPDKLRGRVHVACIARPVPRARGRRAGLVARPAQHQVQQTLTRQTARAGACCVHCAPSAARARAACWPGSATSSTPGTADTYPTNCAGGCMLRALRAQCRAREGGVLAW
ncbi:hypothetical protein O0L34_g15277 [Tuta absoluta]|nr:hypothetical protein O0L34_g15277 [Tuta absoluta]